MEEEVCEEEKSPFPGLNKSHGFFNLIERNQRDRESYHLQQEERKQARKLQVKKELRNEKDSKRRPPKALYCPPQMRQSRSSKEPVPLLTADTNQCFNLEVELQPESWWRGVVQCGQEAMLADRLQKRYHLSPQLREALLDMLLEFASQHF